MSSREDAVRSRRWAIASRLFGSTTSNQQGHRDATTGPTKWSMGILNDHETVEVPGSVLLLAEDRNEPLGLRNIHARTSHSSIPTGFAVDSSATPSSGVQVSRKKRTEDGTIILDPQPDDSVNDPLNWPSWRRDAALLSLGFYCMIGGGITPLIAAGFTDVAHEFDVLVEKVALTTGLCMTGLGIGAVIASPTAILYGKCPIYLAGAIMFIVTALWAGFSPSFSSLLVARVFQGISISPVECLPSATIAKIFFLHERAYRIWVYTLLLLGGKNMVPLVGAAIIGRFGWRWAFYIVAMVVALGFVLLFLFVPETFWDRTPTRKPARKPSLLRRLSSRQIEPSLNKSKGSQGWLLPEEKDEANSSIGSATPGEPGSQPIEQLGQHPQAGDNTTDQVQKEHHVQTSPQVAFAESLSGPSRQHGDRSHDFDAGAGAGDANHQPAPKGDEDKTARSAQKMVSEVAQQSSMPIVSLGTSLPSNRETDTGKTVQAHLDPEKTLVPGSPRLNTYTQHLRQRPAQSFVQYLKPIHGRLNNDNWLKVMVRPFILLAYPAVLWSAIVYSCSIGWLIVFSETMAIVYRDPNRYNFTALQTGLVYISPFIGAILGTGVAGKISDMLVRALSRRNGGLYELEFRLIMAGPILITTCIGLTGFGWSAEEDDRWIVPTVFFGIISFGCSLGSTTSITFCVDSYRQYAAEALVTLNFTKNIMHGLVFSLFVAHWLEKDGPKTVYIWIGVIRVVVCLLSIPMYIFGKRARMWTARKNLMERF